MNLIKKLVKQYWETLLKDNFSSEEIEIVKREIQTPSNEEMPKIIQVKIEFFSLFFLIYRPLKTI